MNIEQALVDIATKFDFDVNELIAYAYEDNIGGYHVTPTLSQWPVGAIWAVEGRILYALVRALKPARVVEIGTHLGCGASHIAAALETNGKGEVITVDTQANVQMPPDSNGHSAIFPIGSRIPQNLRGRVTFRTMKGQDYLRAMSKAEWANTTLIYEDGDHSAQGTREVWELGRDNLPAGGMVVSHDAAHFLAGKAIREGIQQAGLAEQAQVYLVQPADCGLAIWRKPGQTAPQPIQATAEKPKETLRDEIRQFIPPLETVVLEEAIETPDLDVSAMTRNELKAYANTLGLDVTELKSRAQLLAAIEAVHHD